MCSLYRYLYLIPNLFWQARRDSNPQHSVLETDALPLELLAYIIVETHYNASLLCFLVNDMPPAVGAILLKLQLIRRALLVLCRCIILSLALCASQVDNISHLFLLN